MHVDLTQAKGPWMFVWFFNEIIDLLLCQGVALTVFLSIILELFVFVHLMADIRYLIYSKDLGRFYVLKCPA